ncbi:hypothetical protein [Stieleria magnilauensis]|uniref:Uncharacterized protein n=1 Tax=Stieleria magnilauensis TaxID=2527963 RepID=A0ABX5XVE4_9BACT|nr:hypothetical protein TBK1r_47080 [Planctomycetes bacterium TBK1r]
MQLKHFQLASRLLAEIEVFAEIDVSAVGISSTWLDGMRIRGIPFTPEYWSAGHSPSRKMQLVRAARDLERQGLLRRLAEPRRDRTVYVIPSITLLRQTIENLSGQADVDAICLGLRKTHWGTEHAVQLGQWTETLPQLPIHPGEVVPHSHPEPKASESDR